MAGRGRDETGGATSCKGTSLCCSRSPSQDGAAHCLASLRAPHSVSTKAASHVPAEARAPHAHRQGVAGLRGGQAVPGRPGGRRLQGQRVLGQAQALVSLSDPRTLSPAFVSDRKTLRQRALSPVCPPPPPSRVHCSSTGTQPALGPDSTHTSLTPRTGVVDTLERKCHPEWGRTGPPGGGQEKQDARLCV